MVRESSSSRVRKAIFCYREPAKGLWGLLSQQKGPWVLAVLADGCGFSENCLLSSAPF